MNRAPRVSVLVDRSCHMPRKSGQPATRNTTIAWLIISLWICFQSAAGQTTRFVPAPGPPVMVLRGSGPILAADINQDGHLDLITKHLTNRTVSVLPGDGQGHFVLSPTHSLPLDFEPAMIALGNLNHDDLPDVAMASQDHGYENVRVCLGKSGGGFQPASRAIPIRPAARGYKPVLRFLDVNEDGNMDLVSANARRNAIELLLGDGSGNFTPGTSISLESGTNIYAFELEDINTDGHLDLVVTANTDPPRPAPGRLTIRPGNGKGLFADRGSPLLVSPEARVVALADLNGDRQTDVVLAHGRRNFITILLNKGGGRFENYSATNLVDVGLPAFAVVARDLNGDQQVDLAIATVSDQKPFETKIVVLLGNGRGEFTPMAGSPFSAAPGGYTLVAADFDEDGKLDLAASSFESNTVTILLAQ